MIADFTEAAVVGAGQSLVYVEPRMSVTRGVTLEWRDFDFVILADAELLSSRDRNLLTVAER